MNAVANFVHFIIHSSYLTVITNIVFNYHEMFRNEAMGIGLSRLQCQEISAKVSVNISPIFFEKVLISVSAIISSGSISIDIGDNF